MKTSLNETKVIDNYLNGKFDPQQQLLFRADLLINARMAAICEQQQYTYDLVKSYARKQLKAELETIHQKLFSERQHKSFRKKVLSFFKMA